MNPIQALAHLRTTAAATAGCDWRRLVVDDERKGVEKKQRTSYTSAMRPLPCCCMRHDRLQPLVLPRVKLSLRLAASGCSWSCLLPAVARGMKKKQRATASCEDRTLSALRVSGALELLIWR